MFAARKMMMGGKRKPEIVSATSAGTTSNASSFNTTLPADAEVGDLIVVVVAMSSGGNYTATGPAGWTKVLDTGANPSTAIFWKIAVSGDAGSTVTFTFSNTANGFARSTLLFRNAKFDTIGSVGTSSGTATVTAPAIAAAKGILFALFRNQNAGRTFATPAGMASATRTGTGTTIDIFQEAVISGSTGARASSQGKAGGNNMGVLFSIKGK